MTITYRGTNPTDSNIAAGTLVNTVSPAFEFKNRDQLSAATVNTVINSLELTNEQPITGDTTNSTTSELKRKIFDTFPTQNRAVTQADYENIVYRMPAKFGSIARCSVQRDPDSAKLCLREQCQNSHF